MLNENPLWSTEEYTPALQAFDEKYEELLKKVFETPQDVVYNRQRIRRIGPEGADHLGEVLLQARTYNPSTRVVSLHRMWETWEEWNCYDGGPWSDFEEGPPPTP
jgi:hypothetical protein